MITEEIKQAAEEYTSKCSLHTDPEIIPKLRLAFIKGAKWMQQQSFFIPVTERLPKSGENVLIYHKQYGIGIGYCIPLDGSFAGTFHGISVIDENKQCTHWQPLPQMPDK